jgi:uncharacterized protein (TIGR02231 family)
MTAVVPFPIAAVTVLEDRAEVERRAELLLAPGTHRLRLGPVSPLAVDRSLRAEIADGAATVVDARIVRSYTPPPAGDPGPDASALRQRVHRLAEQLRTAAGRRQRAESRLAVLEQLLAELRRDIGESVGAGEAGECDPGRWTADLDRAYAAHTAQAAELGLVMRELALLHHESALAETAVAAVDDRPQVLSAFVDAVVEVPARAGADAAPLVLRLRHLVPCALWRPAYRASLAPDDAAMDLECDAVVWQRTGEDWPQVRLALSTARSARAAEPPRLREDVLRLVDRTPEERRTVEVDLREVEIQSVGPESGGPVDLAAALTLPGVDDGGEARTLVPPAPVTVRGDGRPHRVRLTTATLPVRTEYGCAPELSPLVAQVARFRNDTGQVLLSGPVDLVRGSGFVGRGELRFTAVGATAELSFGSEDTFRVTRSVQESRDTATVTGRTVISRTVLVNVSRFAPSGSAPVTVTLRERIPVSEIAAVEVRLAKDGCEPPPEGVDVDGIVRYELTLAPDERRTLTLAYEMAAARAVAL